MHVAPILDVDAHWFLGFATVKPLPGYGNSKATSSGRSISVSLARISRVVIFHVFYDIRVVWTTTRIKTSPPYWRYKQYKNCANAKVVDMIKKSCKKL